MRAPEQVADFARRHLREIVRESGEVLYSAASTLCPGEVYSCLAQQRIGDRFGGGRHFVDVIAEKEGQKFLISLKWQQVGGTAEQKVPFEVICLAEAALTHGYQKAYLVLGGEDWKLRVLLRRGRPQGPPDAR